MHLYSYSAADVATDYNGNVMAGAQAQVYTAAVAGSLYTNTKTVGPGVTPGTGTGGTVTALADGRIGFFADTSMTLWLDFGDGNRWPVNPTILDNVITEKVDAANTAQEQIISDLSDAVADLTDKAEANTNLVPFGDVPGPYVSYHRGGAWIHPEGTRQGRVNAIGLGADVIDGGDIRITSDGVLYDMHDATMDRTTNLSGNIADTPSMRLLTGKLDCSNWFGGGWQDQPITSILDTLDDLGGKVHITFEVKSGVNPLATQKIVDTLAKRGLTKSVLIASFEEALLTPAIVGGHEVMLLGTSMTTIAERNDLLSKGIRYVGGSASSMTADTAKTMKDKGLRVCAYSTGRHARVDKYALAASGHLYGYMSDDPFYVAGHVKGDYSYRRTTDPFGSQSYYHGHQPDNQDFSPTSRGTFESGGWWKFPTNGNRRAILQGWMSPLASPTSFTVDYEMDFDSAGSSTGAAFVFGCPTDDPFSGDDQSGGGAGDVPGYSCWFFTSGLMRIYRRDPGATPVMIGDLPGSSVTPGTPTKLRVSVSGNTISFRNVTTGQVLTASDNTYRGPYTHLLCVPNGSTRGTKVRNMVVSG